MLRLLSISQTHVILLALLLFNQVQKYKDTHLTLPTKACQSEW